MAGKGWGIYKHSSTPVFENTWSVGTLDFESNSSASEARNTTSRSFEVFSAVTSDAVTQLHCELSIFSRGHVHAVLSIANAK